MSTEQMPELPVPDLQVVGPNGGVIHCHSLGQMRQYAEQRVAAEREACAKLCETTLKLWAHGISTPLPKTVTDMSTEFVAFTGLGCARAIRARSGAQDEETT